MEEIEFVEIVEAICKRPRMYTRYGTLAEVVAFLDGCGGSVINGVSVGGHLPFTNFLGVLEKKLNQPESFTPWEFLLNIYGSEEKVLEELPKRFREQVTQLLQKHP